MSLSHKNVFGYAVAGLGFAITIAACVFLGLKVVESTAVIIVLIIIGCLLIAMGMYVVLPTETEGAIDQVGEVIDKIPFPLLRKQHERSAEPPVVVTPGPGQSTVVNPPAAAEPVLVTPSGETKPLERDGDEALLEDPHATTESSAGAPSAEEGAGWDAEDIPGEPPGLLTPLPLAGQPAPPAKSAGRSKPDAAGLPQPGYQYPPGDA